MSIPPSRGVDLSRFENSWYRSGRSRWIEALWFFAGLPLLRCRLNPSSSIRSRLLRMFGAKVGKNAIIRPGFRVKYPWLLTLGDNCWLGEDVWIDNLAAVAIGDNVCVSQGAYLCTGNHNWSDPAFGLIVKPITLKDSSWAGARSVICPGVELGEGAVAGAGSVVMTSLSPWTVYAGNPAVAIRPRTLSE